MRIKKYSEILLILLSLVLIGIISAIVDKIYSLQAMLIGFFMFFSCFGFIYLISGRIIIGHAFVGFVALLVSFVNYFKIAINGTPLSLNDLSQLGSIAEIAGFALPQIQLTPRLVLAILLFVLSAFAISFFERKIVKDKKIRLSLAALSLVCSLVLFMPASSAGISRLYGASGMSSEELTARFGGCGGLYLSYAGDMEASFSKNTDQLKERLHASDKNESYISYDSPNVIFVMSESFFDVERLDNIEFEADPTPNFHALSKKYSSGQFVSSTYCGGTGYVEMEILTGLCSYYLKKSDNLTALNPDVYYQIPCISDMFLQKGYELTFLHSYNSQLYNREHIYKAFGFHNVFFDDSFPESAQRAGGYISDSAFVGEIISLYEARADKPMFLFAVSMENHQPYSKDKFKEKSPVGFKSNKLTEEEGQIFDSYLHGLHDADRSLGELISYFSNVKEPTLIVFLGDHLPNLNSDKGSVYESLGYSRGGNTALWEGEELLDMVTTDYLIWDNMGLDKVDKMIGSSMLGLEIVNRLGIEKTDFFTFLNEQIKDKYIMHRSRLFVPNEKEQYTSVPEKYKTVSETYSLAVYDIVYGDNKLFKAYRKK